MFTFSKTSPILNPELFSCTKSSPLDVPPAWDAWAKCIITSAAHNAPPWAARRGARCGAGGRGRHMPRVCMTIRCARMLRMTPVIEIFNVSFTTYCLDYEFVICDVLHLAGSLFSSEILYFIFMKTNTQSNK